MYETRPSYVVPGIKLHSVDILGLKTGNEDSTL
jgi:hypothetical protein